MQTELNLEIYVDSNCPTCDFSLEMAEWVRNRFPTLSIRVIDIQKSTGQIPETVFAVPAYLLDGKRIFLGNPEVRTLQLQIERALNLSERDWDQNAASENSILK